MREQPCVKGFVPGERGFVVGLIALVIIVTTIPLARADNVNPGVYPVTSNPYGVTYGQWSAKFWQWMLPIPSPTNPLNDKTGTKCSLNQTGPVWFLPGFNGGPVVRECTIPAGKAILFAALTSECSYAEYPTLKSESDLRSCAINQDAGGVPQVNLDGSNFQGLQTYKVQSPLFNFVFPKDNVFGTSAGPTQGVSDGWYFILQPLHTGLHTLHFGGAVVGNPSTGTQSFALDVTYHLKVQ
jgi:hypothetical protein